MTSPYQHINPSVLLDAAGQDIQAFRELSATFLNIAPPMFQRLQQAIQSGNLPATAMASHALKGTVALVGADRLAAMLARVEALARKHTSASAARNPGSATIPPFTPFTPLADISACWPDLAEIYLAVEEEVRHSMRHLALPALDNQDSGHRQRLQIRENLHDKLDTLTGS